MFREGFWKAVLPLLVGPPRSRIVHCSQLLPSCQSPANSWQTAQVPFNFLQPDFWPGAGSKRDRPQSRQSRSRR